MDYNQNNNQYNQGNYEQPQYSAPQYSAPQYSAPEYDTQYAQNYNQPTYPVKQKEEGKGMAIASLVIGILSVTCCCGGILPSILAVVFGFISKSQKKENNGMALAGIILGFAGIVIGIVSLVYLFATGAYQDLIDEMMYY